MQPAYLLFVFNNARQMPHQEWLRTTGVLTNAKKCLKPLDVSEPVETRYIAHDCWDNHRKNTKGHI